MSVIDDDDDDGDHKLTALLSVAVLKRYYRRLSDEVETPIRARSPLDHFYSSGTRSASTNPRGVERPNAAFDSFEVKVVDAISASTFRRSSFISVDKMAAAKTKRIS